MDTKTSTLEQKTPPYLSFATFLNALNALAEHGIPGIIDRSVLKQFSGQNQGLILASFRFMGFTYEDDTPTDKLKEYAAADPEGRKAVLGYLIKDRFPNQVKILPNGTPNQLRLSFDYITAEASVKAKIISFFVQAAKEAGYAISPHILKGSRAIGLKPPGARKARIKEASNGQIDDTGNPQEENDLEGSTRLPIPIGPGKVWYVIVSKDHSAEEVDRFIKIVKIVLNAEEGKS